MATTSRLTDYEKRVVHADFEAHARKHHDSNMCFQWTGGVDKDGYPRLRGIKNMTGARALYLCYINNDVTGKFVKLSCQNKWCVNPKHLYAADYKNGSRKIARRSPRTKLPSIQAVKYNPKPTEPIVQAPVQHEQPAPIPSLSVKQPNAVAIKPTVPYEMVYSRESHATLERIERKITHMSHALDDIKKRKGFIKRFLSRLAE